jgi:hypothetical protein
MMTFVRRADCVCAALALGAVALAGCGGPSRPAGAAGQPGRSASPGARSATRPAHPAAGSRPVELVVSPGAEVAFTGDVVTAVVSAFSDPGLPLAQATLDFGDGTEVVTQSCARPAPALTAGHVYHRAGTFAIGVTAARFCDPADSFEGLESDDNSVIILPSAPPGSVSWPACAQGQVQISVQGLNAAIGQRDLLFTMRNVSGPDCTMFGYPGLVLVSPDGSMLQSDARRGAGNLFPAIPPHLVAVPAGGTASFLVGYSRSLEYYQHPTSPAPCQAVQDQAGIFLPGSDSYSLVSVATADYVSLACEADFSISPVIPEGNPW